MRRVNVGFTILASMMALGVANVVLAPAASACEGNEKCGDCDKKGKKCPHGKKHKKGEKCDCGHEKGDHKVDAEGSAETPAAE